MCGSSHLTHKLAQVATDMKSPWRTNKACGSGDESLVRVHVIHSGHFSGSFCSEPAFTYHILQQNASCLPMGVSVVEKDSMQRWANSTVLVNSTNTASLLEESGTSFGRLAPSLIGGGSPWDASRLFDVRFVPTDFNLRPDRHAAVMTKPYAPGLPGSRAPTNQKPRPP